MKILKFMAMLLSCCAAVACVEDGNKSMKGVPGSVVYYASIISKGMPFLPVNKIGMDEVNDQHSYLKAEYDGEGRLIRVTKYIEGSIFFIENFNYDKKGRLKLVVLYDGGLKELQRIEY